MHPLKRYLVAHEMTEAQLGALIRKPRPGRRGLHPTSASYISQIINGYRYPSRQMAKLIEQATGGAVPAAALLTFEADKGRAA